MSDCVEYLTIAQVRAEYGDDVATDTDEKIQRRIDQMAAYVEDQLGHSFGRALIATSTAGSMCVVTATELTLGGNSYTFAANPTLQELVNAVTNAGAAYSLELLPTVRPDTPSSLLKIHGAVACGPAYADRVVLCVSGVYHVGSGHCRTHHFLFHNPAAITSVYENGILLAATDYYSSPVESWLIRKECTCGTVLCGHPIGHWSGSYPNNIVITYTPQFWGHVPGTVSSLLLQAYETRGGLTPYSAEQFGDYSYRRKTEAVSSWQDILGSGSLRKYAVKFMP